MLPGVMGIVRFNNGKGEKWKINKGQRRNSITMFLFNFYILQFGNEDFSSTELN